MYSGFMDEWPDRWETEYELSGVECWTLTKAVSWCNRQLTDGHVSARALPKIATDVDSQEFAKRMVELELWEPAERGGWQFVGWSSRDGFNQLASERIKAKREDSAFTSARSRGHKVGDHTLCLPSWCRQAAKSNTPESTRQTWRDGSRDPSRDGSRGSSVTAFTPLNTSELPEGKSSEWEEARANALSVPADASTSSAGAPAGYEDPVDRMNREWGPPNLYINGKLTKY